MKNKSVSNKGAVRNTILSSLEGAAIGAKIGTEIYPGWGTLIGASIGTNIGAVGGYHSGQTNQEKNIKSLYLGQGNPYAGYSSEDMGKDYSFQDQIIGGDPTRMAKIAQGVLTAGRIAGVAAGGFDAMKQSGTFNSDINVEQQSIPNQNPNSPLKLPEEKAMTTQDLMPSYLPKNQQQVATQPKTESLAAKPIATSTMDLIPSYLPTSSSSQVKPPNALQQETASIPNLLPRNLDAPENILFRNSLLDKNQQFEKKDLQSNPDLYDFGTFEKELKNNLEFVSYKDKKEEERVQSLWSPFKY
jgi:hypothetical protein